jgi:hypothetical protein
MENDFHSKRSSGRALTHKQRKQREQRALERRVRKSDEFREFLVIEYCEHKNCARTARVATRYFGFPVSADLVRKCLCEMGIETRRLPSIYDAQIYASATSVSEPMTSKHCTSST